ncbi:MAG TPA: colanic acid biosynthesis glycosyltransferase WcaL [Nitrospirae bacterium]|nr:colanic acid biosynthesis glycosyltransferase WcaL [Nitrospirota bacterium]
MNNNKIAYILGDYPGKVQSFVLNEMTELKHMGFSIYACPINYIPANGKDRPEFDAIYAEPSNLPGIVLSHLFFILSRPVQYLRCLLKYRFYGGKRVFVKSPYFARVITKLGIRRVHSHFGWSATDSARIISCLTGIPFSFTVHAADIYWLPDNLEAKLAEAEFVLTCVENNKKYITRNYGRLLGEKVQVVYHGVDIDAFSPRPDTAEKDFDVLCVGNFVKKKGHRYLVEACAILKQMGVELECLLLGEGPEKDNIVKMVKELGLENYVKFSGRRPRDELPAVYAESRIFVLPSIITESGDRDGIPNVLAEAMAIGLPVISSNVPNISELIEHDNDGILVKQKDAAALAGAIEELLSNRTKSAELGRNARKKVEKAFDSKKHIQKISRIFRQEEHWT